MYQNTVSAGVPATSAVAVAGAPLTRSGGFELKKLSAAAIADAAGNAVCARLPTAVVSAACRLVAVAPGVAPMVNWLAPGGEFAVACSVMLWLVPSGSVKLNWIESPGFGVAAVRSTEINFGEPEGPVTAAPVKVEFTLASLKPNGEPATSSPTVTTEPPPVAGINRRPSPPPTSACWRSVITCVSPAWAPLPLRIALVLATDCWVVALPEKM